MKFNPGQEVTPNIPVFQIITQGEVLTLADAPKFGKLYKVAGYSDRDLCMCGKPCLLLDGFPGTSLMCENCFDAVPTLFDIARALGSTVQFYKR